MMSRALRLLPLFGSGDPWLLCACAAEECIEAFAFAFRHPFRGFLLAGDERRDNMANNRVSVSGLGTNTKVGKYKCSKIQIKHQMFSHVGKFWRARSRLYRNRLLHVDTNFAAFFKIYTICTLLHRCNLKILANTRFEKSAISVKIQQNVANVACRKISKNLPNFKIFNQII